MIKADEDMDAAICYLLGRKQQPQTIAFLLNKSVEEVKRLMALGAQRQPAKAQRKKTRKSKANKK
jgi:hypothetical protein